MMEVDCNLKKLALYCRVLEKSVKSYGLFFLRVFTCYLPLGAIEVFCA